MKFRYEGIALFSVLFSIALSACNFQNKIVLGKEGRGSMQLSLQIPSYMLDDLEILSESLPGGSELLKPTTIMAELKKSKDISNVDVKSPKKGSYQISFRFQNFNRKAVKGQSFLQWSKQGNGSTKLSITLNRQSYISLEEQFPLMKDNPLLQFYGPATTVGMSRNDYLDMVEYSFGSAARKDLPSAIARIVVEVPSKVIQQTGGRKQGNQEVVFTIPLMDLLLLDRAKTYSITY